MLAVITGRLTDSIGSTPYPIPSLTHERLRCSVNLGKFLFLQRLFDSKGALNYSNFFLNITGGENTITCLHFILYVEKLECN